MYRFTHRILEISGDSEVARTRRANDQIRFASIECITVIIRRTPKRSSTDPRGKYSRRITETDVVIPAPWQECHDSSLRTYVGRQTERLREFRMRARNASQNRLQSDWRESLWRFFSFNFSIRPARRGMETGASSVFWPSAKRFLRVSPWRRFHSTCPSCAHVYMWPPAVILCVNVTGLKSCNDRVLNIAAFSLECRVPLSYTSASLRRC